MDKVKSMSQSTKTTAVPEFARASGNREDEVTTRSAIGQLG